MRAVLQRVTYGRVKVGEDTLAEIGPGLVILLGIGHGDGEEQAQYLAEKIANLRIFEDEEGKMNLSAVDVKAEMVQAQYKNGVLIVRLPKASQNNDIPIMVIEE